MSGHIGSLAENRADLHNRQAQFAGGLAIDARASARLNRINLKNKSFFGGARPYER
jgi:hypothetical protein